MNPNATITDEEFEAYLLHIRALAEGPFEEMQKEIGVTNKFPEAFYDLARDNDLHTTAIKDEDGNYILNGEKWLISHTDCSDFTYVIAVTNPDDPKDTRLSAFFAPAGSNGGTPSSRSSCLMEFESAGCVMKSASAACV